MDKARQARPPARKQSEEYAHNTLAPATATARQQSQLQEDVQQVITEDKWIHCARTHVGPRHMNERMKQRTKERKKETFAEKRKLMKIIIAGVLLLLLSMHGWMVLIERERERERDTLLTTVVASSFPRGWRTSIE